MKRINIKSSQKNYSIFIENNLLFHLKDYLDSSKFYIIISDSQIPKQYINLVLSACTKKLFISFPAGESSKSFFEYKRIIDILQANNIKRDACIIALGGGVTGDLSGFIASTYLRGIELIHIPTTLLSQIDSSIGGKVAINTIKAKNSIGTFYSPSKVIIDPITLNTLSKRQFNSGLGEMIKYGMIFSKSFFDDLLFNDITNNLESYIYKSLLVKKYFIENDEFDQSIRQILNYGHTYGHAYEAYYSFNKYLHGEAVALGMLKVASNSYIKQSLLSVLKKYNLPTFDDVNDEELLKYIKNDKKNTAKHFNLIVVDEIGKAYIKKVIL